ncbi:MAG TPA: amidohydrolase [Candidatus Butyricicoccus avistercoris]|uniref:Amidohydrolase n=1 Tax=Candidatus Butyricicoccus avistercoris TaxID=2838518 RepID=A0A9D1PJD2_9FIRM|nr:amidohydrolase [Candidatus Butyricicoccus avistercoris]
MLFEHIDYLDENFEVKKDAFIGVKDGKIAYIGTEKPEEDFGEVYNGKHGLMMSGFVNAHSHAPMTLLRGYGENLPLDRWLNEKIFPFEDKLTDNAIAASTTLACAEMIRFGTVSFSDMYFFSQTMAKSILDSGMKCNLSRGLTVFSDQDYEQLEAYKDNVDLLKNYQNAGNGRLKIDLCIHGEYTTTPKVVEALAKHAKSENVNVHIHLSETKKEHEECKQRHGKTPAKYFADLGLFDQPTTAAHCVWVEDEDIELLKKYGVTVACNPVSNIKLASGFAPIPKMLEKGVNIALGTDGCASNNNLNIMQDLYLFALLYKGVTGDPTVVTPKQALMAATLNGFKSQGRMDSGKIALGQKADIIVINTDVPNMYPATDIACNLVYAAQGNDIKLTMVDGKVLYKDGEYLTIDIERAKAQTQMHTDAILQQL